jgi:hypothetical protein
MRSNQHSLHSNSELAGSEYNTGKPPRSNRQSKDSKPQKPFQVIDTCTRLLRNCVHAKTRSVPPALTNIHGAGAGVLVGAGTARWRAGRCPAAMLQRCRAAVWRQAAPRAHAWPRAVRQAPLPQFAVMPAAPNRPARLLFLPEWQARVASQNGQPEWPS